MIKPRRTRWARHATSMGGEEECIQDFGWKCRGKRGLRRPKCRWKDNIKMDVRRDRMGWYGLD
jgi:hypothetical protein